MIIICCIFLNAHLLCTSVNGTTARKKARCSTVTNRTTCKFIMYIFYHETPQCNSIHFQYITIIITSIYSSGNYFSGSTNVSYYSRWQSFCGICLYVSVAGTTYGFGVYSELLRSRLGIYLSYVMYIVTKVEYIVSYI